MKLLIIFFTSLFVQSSHAAWLCTEASSLAENDYFYSCGVAVSPELYQARKQALNNAKDEFNSFCDESYNCKNNEYIITPLRTDCKKKNNQFTCYRGLQYRVLDKKREYSSMSIFQLKRSIIEKQRYIRKMNKKIDHLKQIEELDSNISDLEDLDDSVLELDKLNSSYQDVLSQGMLGLSVSLMNLDLGTHTASIFGIGIEYEKFLYRDTLGVNIDFKYLTGLSNEAELESRGDANTTSAYDYYSHQGYELNVSMPVHIQYLTIAPKIGYTSLSYKGSANIYNSFGVPLGSESVNESFDGSFYGLNIRYGNRAYFEIEARQYSDSDMSYLGGVGIKIAF